jgi:hypothetical protein
MLRHPPFPLDLLECEIASIASWYTDGSECGTGDDALLNGRIAMEGTARLEKDLLLAVRRILDSL